MCPVTCQHASIPFRAPWFEGAFYARCNAQSFALFHLFLQLRRRRVDLAWVLDGSMEINSTRYTETAKETPSKRALTAPTVDIQYAQIAFLSLERLAHGAHQTTEPVFYVVITTLYLPSFPHRSRFLEGGKTWFYSVHFGMAGHPQSREEKKRKKEGRANKHTALA